MNDTDSRSHVEVHIKRTISFTVYLTFYLRLELIQKVSATKEIIKTSLQQDKGGKSIFQGGGGWQKRAPKLRHYEF